MRRLTSATDISSTRGIPVPKVSFTVPPHTAEDGDGDESQKYWQSLFLQVFHLKPKVGSKSHISRMTASPTAPTPSEKRLQDNEPPQAAPGILFL